MEQGRSSAETRLAMRQALGLAKAREADDAGRPPVAGRLERSHPLISLQQQLGNQSVQRLLQAKLRVSQPGDVYEREADRVAEQVVCISETVPAASSTGGRRATPGMKDSEKGVCDDTSVLPRLLSAQGEMLQRNCSGCEGSAPCAQCEEEEKGTVQRKGEQESDTFSTSVPEGFSRNLRPGFPLDRATRVFVESSFGHDFGEVRVHADSQAAESARSVNALAYTVGRDIVFDTGQYAPETRAGLQLLAHELAHVLHQSSNASATLLQRQPREPGVCDSTNLGTLGPMFKKPESEVITLGLTAKMLKGTVTPGEEDFVLYCPHRASLPLKGLILSTNVYFIGSGKVSGKDEVWAHQIGETDMFWGFIKNTKYATAPPPTSAPTPSATPPSCVAPTNPDESGKTFNPTTDGTAWVAFWHPFDAGRGKQCADHATEISTVTWPGSTAPILPGSSLGPQDAFRHCLWNCCMAQNIGASRAEQFATAHENDGPSPIPFDNQMDLHDNSIGRGLGKPGIDCISACNNALKSGRLRTIRGPHVTGSPVPTDCIGASNQPWP